MKAMLKNVVLSYVNLFEARKMNDSGDASYSVCLLIDKDSPEVPKIKAAIEEAVKEMVARYPKLKGTLPKMWNNPLRDGDAEKDGEEYKGRYFINCKRKESQGAPLVIDGRKQIITEKAEVYSGCIGNVAVSFYPYEFTGKYGVGVGLNAVQKAAEGPRLDGGTSIDEFDTLGNSGSAADEFGGIFNEPSGQLPY